MELSLSKEEANELLDLLTNTMGELSTEITDTDNAEFRRFLKARRERLQRILQALEASSAPST